MPAPTFLDLARSIDRQLHGNIQYPVRSIVFGDSPYSVSVDDDFINADATLGNITVTLPSAVLYPGIPFGVKKVDVTVNTVTVQGTGGQTIDGAATKVLVNTNDYLVAVSDGTNWKLYSVVISSASSSGAVFYQIAKIIKTNGITTLVPVAGTLINFTVAVDGECSFFAAGLWSGVSSFPSGSLNFRIDGVDYAPQSFGMNNGSGGDFVSSLSLSPHVSVYLTAGPHTVQLVASESGLGLNASAADPLTLSVLFPGASANVAQPTPKAATFVVDPTPGIGDYTTIQNALNNLPAAGGYILVREGTYAETLTFPDKPVVLRGCGDGTIIDLGVVAATAFTIGHNQKYTIEDLQVLGDATAAQKVLSVTTNNGTKKILLNRVNSYDSVKSIFTSSAGTTPLVEIKSSALRGVTTGWTAGAGADGGTLILTDLSGTFGSVSASAGSLVTRNAALGATVSVADTSVIEGARGAASTGSTTNAYVTIFTHTNPRGLVGVGTIKNTDGANTLTVKETVTDAFGTSTNTTTDVAPGNYYILNPQAAIDTARPPYVSYAVAVIDKVGGSHATYELHHVSQGSL